MACRAETSIGALTFHFRNKTALAEEVRLTGRARFGRSVAGLATAADPLAELRALVDTLARLAHEDRFVRAVRRLEADPPDGAHRRWPRPGCPSSAPCSTGPTVPVGSARASRPRRRRAMLAHLAEGAMAAHGTLPGAAWGAARDAIWDVVLHGLAADRVEEDGRQSPRADGRRRDGRGSPVEESGRRESPVEDSGRTPA